MIFRRPLKKFSSEDVFIDFREGGRWGGVGREGERERERKRERERETSM